MIVQDHRKLAKLLVIQGVSHRQLADAVGWESHSYVSRLVRGEVKTLKPEKAVAIAHYLGVGVDDLFLAKSDRIPGRHGQDRAA